MDDKIRFQCRHCGKQWECITTGSNIGMLPIWFSCDDCLAKLLLGKPSHNVKEDTN